MKTINKWLLLFLFCFLFLAGHSSMAQAAENVVDDQASLFTEDQRLQLQQEMTPLSEKTKATIFIVTINQNPADSPRDYADGYILDHLGKDQNAVLLLLDMANRKIYISTSGNMIDYLTDSRIEETLDAVYEGMSSINYFLAAKNFIAKTADFVQQGVPGGHYRIDEETGKITRYKSITSTEAFIAILAAIILSVVFFAVTVSKYQLKFGTYKYPFREKATVSLTEQEDQLTNSFITTRRIPRNTNSGGGLGGGGSSTHSSGGGTFGGGGRSF